MRPEQKANQKRLSRHARHSLKAVTLCLLSCMALWQGNGCQRNDRSLVKGAGGSGSEQPTKYRRADLRVLFIGNSHTGTHRMPQLVAKLYEAAHPGKEMYVETVTGPSYTLAQHLASIHVQQLLDNLKWDFIVLQGQAYSTTGTRSYPYDAALELTAKGIAGGARVFMFPEWRRRGHLDEARRIMQLHEEIVAESGAEIAPVGIGWDRAWELEPDLPLHASDGNHCSELGALLTSYLLLTALTDCDPRQVDETGDVEVVPETRRLLQQVAWETVEAHRMSKK